MCPHQSFLIEKNQPTFVEINRDLAISSLFVLPDVKFTELCHRSLRGWQDKSFLRPHHRLTCHFFSVPRSFRIVPQSLVT